MKHKHAVLAGNYAEFKEFSINNKDKDLVFCDAWPKFAGLRFTDVIEVGTFRSRPDAFDIYQKVLPMVRRDTKVAV